MEKKTLPQGEGPMKKGIYNGLKVLDLSRVIAGPYCSMLLADMGADVVKVEKKGSGDHSRAYFPKVNGESLYFFVMNRNKRSLELDFRSEEGRKILFDLACKADVIVENFRPGTLSKMGLEPEAIREVNPGVIIASISGFGQEGPYAHRPGFDAIAQAMSGLMSLTGDPDGPPMMTGAFFVDHMTGMYAAMAIQAALYQRQQTGRGQNVEACLLDSAISVLLTAIPQQLVNGETMTRIGNDDRYTAPSNLFKTKDGEWVYCIAGTDEFFRRFAIASNKEFLLEDERFATVEGRMAHRAEVEKHMEDWIKEHTADEIIEITEKAGITCAKVETIAGVVKNPQLAYRKKIIEIEHPKMGKVPMQGFPFGFSDTELEVRYPAPMLGQHSAEVLKEWLGFDDQRIDELRAKNII